jgi:hypothetical protein
MAFTPNNAGEYVKQPRRWVASIGNGDASAWKILYNASQAGAGPNGSKISGVGVAGNDTSARVVQLALAWGISGVTTPVASPGIVSFPASNPGYNLAVGDQVMFLNNGDTLPTGLAFNTTYFIIAAGFTVGTSFELATSAGGSAINFTVSTSGTHLMVALKPITAVTVAITAGTDGVTATADLTSLDPAFPTDNDGEKYLYMESGDYLAVSSTTTVTANKMISIKAWGGDF